MVLTRHARHPPSADPVEQHSTEVLSTASRQGQSTCSAADKGRIASP